MPIPDYQTLMLPLLTFAQDGAEHSNREAIDVVAVQFNLTDEERRELLSSGQAVFENRLGWARTYLKKAGLLKATRRGYFQITQEGSAALSARPARIDNPFLEQYPAFVEFRTPSLQPSETTTGATPTESEKSPEDLIEAAYKRLRNDLAQDLIQQIKSCSSTFFERLVVDLLVRMGYGGTRADAGRAIGKSGDGGIDGIIKEDRLGLDAIYLQAKRWTDNVGRPEIQKFVGALHGQRARKGVFITTSRFSPDALQYVGSVETKVVLIDGDMLAKLMIDYGVGTTKVASYELNRIDADYFLESE